MKTLRSKEWFVFSTPSGVATVSHPSIWPRDLASVLWQMPFLTQPLQFTHISVWKHWKAAITHSNWWSQLVSQMCPGWLLWKDCVILKLHIYMLLIFIKLSEKLTCFPSFCLAKEPWRFKSCSLNLWSSCARLTSKSFSGTSQKGSFKALNQSLGPTWSMHPGQKQWLGSLRDTERIKQWKSLFRS